MLYMKKFLSLLLVLGLLGSSQVALAAEESPAPLPVWSHSILADGYSLGLFGDEISVQHSQTVTMEQVEALAQTVEDKLALLDLEPRPADGTALVLDTTRGGVMNALYQEAAAYAFPGVEQGPEAFMTSVGALAGDGSGLHLDRPCTVLEAAAMANSLILNLYDWQDAGSLGLLWRADNGRGNVLYLLGSIHTDRNNLYPFHKQLRDVILNAEQVSFELDFNDTDQLLEFAAMQTYPAGDSLANHISPALYQAVVQAAAQLGMDEGTVSQYKPWALANSFASLATLDETSSENAMAIDLYVNAKAINAGIDIGAVETYAFQGQIFDTLSPEYQEQYLASGLLLILDPDSISQETRDALTEVLGEDAFRFRQAMETLRENYPPFAWRSAMNFLGTHDTPRILTLLGTGGDGKDHDKDWRAAFRMSSGQYALGKARLKLGALVIFAFPGSPMVYYGDEAGMEGFEDPFNRRTYPWGREDGELLEWYTALGKARRALPALRRGELAWTLTRGRVLSFLRTGAEGSVLAAVNAGERPEPIDLPWPARDWMTGAALEQGEQTLPPMTGWLLTPRPEGA